MDPIREGSQLYKWTRAEGHKSITPPILIEYQEMMRGIDLVDQC